MADLSNIPTDQLMQMLQQHPDAQAAAPAPSAASDSANTVIPGLLRGAINSAASLGNVMFGGDNATNLMNEAASKAGLKERIPTMGQAGINMLEKLTGPLYQPKTKTGEYVNSIAEMAPAAIAGPEGLLPKIASVVEPAVGSQFLGDQFKDTRFEDLAKLAGSLGGGLLSGVRAAPAMADSVPSTSALKQAAHASYDAAERAGVMVSSDSLNSMVKATKDKLAAEGIHPKLHPNAMAALGSLQDAADAKAPITLKGMDTLRQISSDAIGNSMMAPADKRMSYIVKNNIDDFVNGLKPNDLVGSEDPQAAIDALNSARGLWSKASKSDVIQKRIDRADVRAGQYSQAGNENALRVEFRQLAMNDKAMARFTPSEQDAIRAVSKGGSVTNALRLLGKFSPQGPVSTAIGAGTGFVAGGPPGAIALPLAGALAKAAATKLTQQAALNAAKQMRRGAPAPTNPLLSYTNPYPGLFGSSAPSRSMMVQP